ncbi:MAG: T9SS type A sorting domain-containing protein [Bacteroidia bacterium]|nr:T9SS type A sorting domain-containing protein [Bacteroidia bacterium]
MIRLFRNIDLGDTFIIYDSDDVANSFSVDSVYYVGNIKHVRLNAWTNMCAFNEKITFIEGSGTTAGLSYQRNFWYGDSYMLCHHKNGVKVAGNILFNDTCEVHFVGITENNFEKNLIKIFPDPTIDNLNIEIENLSSDNCVLSIFNMLGEKIYFQKIINRITKVDVSKLNKGIYFVLFDDRIPNRHYKFIKD